MNASETAARAAGTPITGAEIVCRALAEEGVTKVFGYPGGAVIPIYDEIFKQSAFQHILTGHEQGAAHAADAYARATGKPGVLIVTSGPGATNAVTGISTAYSDSIPLIIISGQVGTSFIGTDAFQECDTVGITRPCVKHNFLVRHVEDLAKTIKEAFYIATTGRPGPVLIDIPKDIQLQKCVFDYPEKVDIPTYKPITRGHMGQIRKALNALLDSARPLILVGGGVVLSDASELMNRFARLTGIPVISTLMGLGGFRGSDRKFLGMAGMHGTLEANYALQNSEVLINFGSRMEDRLVSNVPDFESRPRTVIHIDVDPSSISKRVKAQIPIVGDVKSVLADMVSLLEEEDYRQNTELLTPWWNQIDEWRSRKSLDYPADSKSIMPEALVEKVQAAAPADTIYTTDVGEHQMYAAQYLKLDEPRHFLTSGGQGTMGFGLPAAVGAAVAFPDKPVVCFTGDGSIQMCIQELITCKRYGLAPKIVIFNNGYLGMVAVWQKLYCGGRLSETTLDPQPDFVALAKAYGHVGYRCRTYAELDAALKDAFGENRNECCVLDVQIKRDEPVYPMVGPGEGLTRMILREE
ncbi:biosynthetic-type acetolactate synthase large subunit [Mesosutterella multiformis]|jgi:acetolactate synthase-1/2/3 large subunit|uniref:Acetolactate synthase n=1 Tax=Mesosutterella multiformis TaxID=2259133 RepID=A0A388SB50_9BURK|nr:biosynthetic-type acetolactate synthase large subunit [Mesosutterella multiformis]MBS5810940.1 biosynthetic-type acetolactate synthase large subunit [Sutterella sp.]RGU79759.1 biosynthetic-type acetolactate synthase large subunit [Sutterella sp. AF15-45LB]RGU80638.1 biosynthetic-type acetolactate synthase large subunit [Sutterella sp. AF15-44LB]RHH06213.1 biosynthetic-type acetolactate synthase large subunit [Sutterella sp. AM18-8-1]MBM6984348.1 biosynthetic-type acetolactate synthase large